MMVKSLRHWHRSVVKSINNTENKPQNQQQNNNQKEVNISILVGNPLHDRSGWILEPKLPRHGCIPIGNKHKTAKCSHLFIKKE
jgi:hypothetical protein